MANSRSGESLVQRVARILRAFDPEHRELGAAQIAQRAGLAGSTAHRLVGELVAEGLLRRTAAGRYRIGLELWEVVQRGSLDQDFGRMALPFLEAVHVSQRQTTALSILDDEQRTVVYLERLGRSAPTDLTSVAGRLPVLCTASGLVELAFRPPAVQERYLAAPWDEATRRSGLQEADIRRLLARARTEGHLHLEGVLVPGSSGTAVPVLGPEGRVLGALSIVSPSDEASVGAQVPALRAAGRGLSRLMGGAGPAR